MAFERKLKISSTGGEGGRLVRLVGVLDETFDREQLYANSGEVTIFDLEGVRRITSFGVREWINALRDFPGQSYGFIRCRPTIVAQFNMVAQFGGVGKLISLFAPYVCPNCAEEVEILVDLRHEYAMVSSGEPPPAKCTSCGAMAEFDDVPQAYFSYVASRPIPVLPAVAERLIAGGGSAASPARLVIRKEVSGQVTALWLSGLVDERARFKRLADGLEGDVVAVMPDIKLGGDSGLVRLTDLVQLPDLTIYFARVPPAVVQAIALRCSALVRGRIVSMWTPATCTPCDTTIFFELGSSQLRAPQSLAGLVCPKCGMSITLEVAPEILEAAAALSTPPPPAIALYLAERRGADVPSASTEGGSAASSSVSSSRFAVRAYEIIRKIGTGGMAEIYLAKQRGPEGFEKSIALKRILPHFSENREFVEMFLHEARVAARVSHPNVVQIFDLGVQDGQYFIAMEYIKGWDLRTLIGLARRGGGQMPIDVTCRIVADVCAGLHGAHSCSDDNGTPLLIVHRDISPRNVLVSSDGAVKVTDFGIAKAANQILATRPGTMKGKVNYMAPEQVERADSVDARADIFAVGVILFECLAGVHPFRKESEFSTLRSVLLDPTPSASAIRPEVPAAIEAVINKALERALLKRYPTAQAMHIDLEAAMASSGLMATTASVARWATEITEEVPASQAVVVPPDESIEVSLTSLEGETMTLTRVLLQDRDEVVGSAQAAVGAVRPRINTDLMDEMTKPSEP